MFTLELPRAAKSGAGDEKPCLINSSNAEDQVTRDKARGGRILVVEDEPTVAQLIADVLREEGFLVDTILDSRQGLDLARGRRYDLIICDLRMPHLDGRAFYRQLVRDENPLQHRLIFVTGDTLAPRTVDFLQTCGLPYLAKPFLVEELKEVVGRTLEQISGLPATSTGAPQRDEGVRGYEQSNRQYWKHYER